MKRLLLLICTVCTLAYARTSAFVLLDFAIGQQQLINAFANVHIGAGGNDAGGAFFFLPLQALQTPMSITLGSETITCTMQVHGLYYNSIRGNRLRPLSQTTLDSLKEASPDYATMTVEGGRFTNCTKPDNTRDLYSIYGSIKHTFGSNDYYMIAGTKYNWDANTYTPQFAQSFQYFDNKSPVGFFYDTMGGGIPFVGGMLGTGTYPKIIADLNTNKVINQVFSYTPGETGLIASGQGYNEIVQGTNVLAALNLAWGSIQVQGLVGLGLALRDPGALVGNPDQRASVISAPNLNVGTLLNTANNRASQLCRGITSTSITESGPVLCFSNTNITIDLSNTTHYNGKTIVIQDGHAILQNSMPAGNNSIDLFVNKGNIYFANGISNLQQIDVRGNVVASAGVTQGRYLRGILMVNGLIVGGNGSTPAGIENKLYMEGRVSSLNTVGEPVAGRISQVENTLGAGFTNFINLENVFTWRCNPISAVGPDSAKCDNPNDQFANVAFILRESNITSRLLSQ